MRAIEFLSETDVIKISSDNKAKEWIKKVYDLYPGTWQNNHVMTWGEGENQQFSMFELVPSFSKKDAVEVKWFQAYPLRQGVGSRAMQELQRLAKEDGIGLTLFPWDKGQVSQAKLMKFYKGQGFQPNKSGSKNMYWAPEVNEEINPDIQNSEFKHSQRIGDYLLTADHREGERWLNIRCYQNRRLVGKVDFFNWGGTKGYLASGSTEVHPDYRKQGIAYTMYAYARMLGNDISPGGSQSDDGKAMWAAWDKSGEAKHLTGEVDEAVLDTRGWGNTPQGIDVDYFGLQVKMRPSMFLKLAAPLTSAGENPAVAQHMEKGGKIAYPFLDIQDPTQWEEGDFSKEAKVKTHEGRNRMKKWIQLKGDDPIQVNIFLRGANRRRYITPEMIKKLSQGVYSESGQWVNGPLFDPNTAK